MRRMWHVWPGQWWPLLPDQEAAFVAELVAASPARATKPDRDDITSLLNILRCGADLSTVIQVAPGIKPARLLAAYRLLEARRSESEQAWLAIENDPDVHTLRIHASVASRILPVPVHRILATVDQAVAEGVTEAIAAASAQIHHLKITARGIEHELQDMEAGSERGMALGVKLFHPHDPGIFGNPYFLPERISALSPVRVTDLLGAPRGSVE